MNLTIKQLAMIWAMLINFALGLMLAVCLFLPKLSPSLPYSATLGGATGLAAILILKVDFDFIRFGPEEAFMKNRKSRKANKENR